MNLKVVNEQLNYEIHFQIMIQIEICILMFFLNVFRGTSVKEPLGSTEPTLGTAGLDIVSCKNCKALK